MKAKIAVFASGSGSNFQAIQEAIERGDLQASIELVVTDKPGAFVVTRANNFGIEVLELAPKTFESKAAYEEAIVAELRAKDKALKQYRVQFLIFPKRDRSVVRSSEWYSV